jgi:hypothetical protein
MMNKKISSNQIQDITPSSSSDTKDASVQVNPLFKAGSKFMQDTELFTVLEVFNKDSVDWVRFKDSYERDSVIELNFLVKDFNKGVISFLDS